MKGLGGTYGYTYNIKVNHTRGGTWTFLPSRRLDQEHPTSGLRLKFKDMPSPLFINTCFLLLPKHPPIQAGIHAREWIAPAVATFIVRELVEDYAEHPDYIDKINWWGTASNFVLLFFLGLSCSSSLPPITPIPWCVCCQCLIPVCKLSNSTSGRSRRWLWSAQVLHPLSKPRRLCLQLGTRSNVEEDEVNSQLTTNPWSPSFYLFFTVIIRSDNGGILGCKGVDPNRNWGIKAFRTLHMWCK